MSDFLMTGTHAAGGAGELSGPSFTIPLDRLASGRELTAALELLLAAVAADALAATRAAAVTLNLDVGDIEVQVRVAPAPAGTLVVSYDLRVGRATPEARLAQLHAELRRTASVMRVIGMSVQLTGSVRQRPAGGAG